MAAFRIDISKAVKQKYKHATNTLSWKEQLQIYFGINRNKSFPEMHIGNASANIKQSQNDIHIWKPIGEYKIT